jgi:parallel beta helix pectate lyase-like protein
VRNPRCLVIGLGVALGVLASASTVSAATIYVRDEVQFEQAMSAFRDRGGRVVLLRHLYRRALVIGQRSSGQLTIVGTPGARVQTLDLDATRAVAVERLTIAPLGGDSHLLVDHSRDVVLSQMTFTAAGTSNLVDVQLDHSIGVTVRASSFSHCGDGSPDWSLCLRPGWASHVTIEDNRFHDCLGCDFIHGRAGVDTTIRDNRFNRALACSSGAERCFHQDMVELFAAKGLVVSRNRFGVTQRGGAQLYLTNAVDDVRIANNLFKRSDPRAPGVHSPVGIFIGASTSPHLPHHVDIINNTILSGWRTRKHAAMSVLVSPRYIHLKRSNRPLLANNVLARVLQPHLLCDGLDRSIRNVVAEGRACSVSDSVGDPHVGARGRPTRASLLLIDRADAALAPPYDLTGRPRGGRPDIGCYEYVRH